MSTYQALQEKNPHLEILPVTDPGFHRYGRVLAGAKADRAVSAARKMWVVADSVDYSVSVPEFEADAELQETIARRVYGEMPVQVGWVFGRNYDLNGLEYHQGSEVHIPLEDTLFFLAHYEEIQWSPDPSIDTSKVRAFFAPRGTVVELYTWCLHFVPINASRKAGFCNVFTLLRGSGTKLDSPKPSTPDGKLLIAKNQWLMVHPDAKGLVEGGNYVGLTGENLKINPID